MNTKRTAVTAAAVLTLLGTLFSSPATAAPPQGDFTATGVKIRSSYNTTTTSSVRGHGNPGDGYTWMGGQSNAEAVHCPDGSVKDHWTYVHNNRTGVEGYVSDCFIREF